MVHGVCVNAYLATCAVPVCLPHAGGESACAHAGNCAGERGQAGAATRVIFLFRVLQRILTSEFCDVLRLLACLKLLACLILTCLRLLA